MARKKPEKTYQYWVDKILVSLKEDIIIWQSNRLAPVPGVVMTGPVTIEGASPTWKLTLVCTPEFGSPAQFNGTAEEDRSGTVVQLNSELVEQIFNIANEILTRKPKNVWTKRSNPVSPVVRGKTPC
jgi:hypothetical protein